MKRPVFTITDVHITKPGKAASKLAYSSVFKIRINHGTVVSILCTSSDKITLLIVQMIDTIHDMTTLLFYIF
jgi:hypothetical protein